MITAVVTLFFALVVLLIAAYHITKYVTKEDPAFEDPTPTYTKEELDNIKLAEYRDWETDRKSTRLNSSHRL